MALKTCKVCGERKECSEFYKSYRSIDGYNKQCRMCANKLVLERRRRLSKQERKIKDRINNLIRTYGIRQIRYNAIFKKQCGRCAICLRNSSEIPEKGYTRVLAVRTLEVDHCHTTKKIRGLLCVHCNLIVSFINNHPHELPDNTIVRAKEYIEYHRRRHQGHAEDRDDIE